MQMPNYNQGDGTFKFALVQTGCFGDCVNSTLMFEPIKKKWPNSRIDVHTSTVYGSAFHNNPLIDRLFEHEAKDKNSALHLHLVIPKLLVDAGYDWVEMAHPMFECNHGNWTSIQNGHLGTNLICAWVRALEHKGVPYTLPLRTSLRLTDAEHQRANEFVDTFSTHRRRVLMELGAESGQTQWTDEWTIAVGRQILSHDDVELLISRRHDSSDIAQLAAEFGGRAHFVGGLSLRECAAVYDRCHAFISTSSGLSNVCNTQERRTDLAWYEVINNLSCSSFPVRSEGKVFWTSGDLGGFVEKLRSDGW